MRRAARIDVAQKPIVDGLRLRGVASEPMPIPGDILTYGQRQIGAFPNAMTDPWIFMPMEIKSDMKTRGYKPELTKSQQRRQRSGFPIPIVHNLAEALALYGRSE